MTIAYLASFLGGLLFAVYIMLFGVERQRPFGAVAEPSFRLSPPTIAAFLTVFGAVGYVAERMGLASMTVALVAAAAGIASSLAAAQAVRRWWTVVPEHDPDDPRYVLQGLIARTTRAIPSDGGGEVAFEVEGQRRVMQARSVDGQQVDTDTEVVIERIEDDVAFVEPWAVVEKRL